jgi:uncharacterized protein YjiS (DUF1127 family)
MQILKSLAARYTEWASLREAEAELNAFSDRELADLGINRSDISYLVRQKQPGQGMAQDAELSARATRRASV